MQAAILYQQPRPRTATDTTGHATTRLGSTDVTTGTTTGLDDVYTIARRPLTRSGSHTDDIPRLPLTSARPSPTGRQGHAMYRAPHLPRFAHLGGQESQRFKSEEQALGEI